MIYIFCVKNKIKILRKKWKKSIYWVYLDANCNSNDKLSFAYGEQEKYKWLLLGYCKADRSINYKFAV